MDTPVSQQAPSSAPTKEIGSKPTQGSLVVPILGLLVLVLLGLSGFLVYQNMSLQNQIARLAANQTPMASIPPILAPTTDPTANWKTVTSKFWTFKVPPNLNSVQCSSMDQLLIGSPSASNSLFDQDKTAECNFDQPGDLLSVFRGLDNTGNAVIIPTNTDPKLDPTVSNRQDILVDEKKAVFQQETTSMGQGTGTWYKVYIHQLNYTDVITFNDVGQKSLFDQILSTFRFTNQAALDTTANWVSYTPTDVSIKVPPQLREPGQTQLPGNHLSLENSDETAPLNTFVINSNWQTSNAACTSAQVCFQRDVASAKGALTASNGKNTYTQVVSMVDKQPVSGIQVNTPSDISSGTNIGGYSDITYYVEKNGNVVQLSFHILGDPNTATAQSPLIDRILSTFAFTQ